jgi:hypothetical protein
MTNHDRAEKSKRILRPTWLTTKTISSVFRNSKKKMSHKILMTKMKNLLNSTMRV